MPFETHANTPVLLWTGRILSGLVVAFLLLDASVKLVPIKPVMDAQQSLGFSDSIGLARGLGALLLSCTVLYAIPRTSLLGAVLLTGYLGGTIAIHLRAGHPLFTHILFGGYIGILLWIGLFARDIDLRGFVWRAHGTGNQTVVSPDADGVVRVRAVAGRLDAADLTAIDTRR